MDSFPIEILDIIASQGSQVYYGLLGYKFFTDTLSYGKRVDFMIKFGYSVYITKDVIVWGLNGKLHRVDGPAVEYVHEFQEWWKNRRCRSIPVLEYIHGDTRWYLYGNLHREGGPAIEGIDGTKHWYYKGKQHRVDGPASIYCDGGTEYYRDGEYIRPTWSGN